MLWSASGVLTLVEYNRKEASLAPLALGLASISQDFRFQCGVYNVGLLWDGAFLLGRLPSASPAPAYRERLSR